MAQYGYSRISTPRQSIERQERNIKAAYPNAILISEVFTGAKTTGREKFEKLISNIQSGDIIIFDSVSRMSRNADEGFSLYQYFFNKGVNLVFLKEPHIDTATYRDAIDKQLSSISTGEADTDELMNGILAAINQYMMRLAQQQIRLAFIQAEKEVSDLRQRTKEGLETARINGKQIGQKTGSKLNIKKAAAAKKIIQTHSKAFGGSLSDEEVIKLTGISRNTYYRYKRELKQK